MKNYRGLFLVAIGIATGIITISLLEFFKGRFPWETRMVAGAVLALLVLLLYLFKKQEDIKEGFQRAFQGKVDACLRKRAGEFLAACQEAPPNAQKIRVLKEKFWRAHNLAWSLGFAVRPKVRDYVREGR